MEEDSFAINQKQSFSVSSPDHFGIPSFAESDKRRSFIRKQKSEALIGSCCKKSFSNPGKVVFSLLDLSFFLTVDRIAV